MALVQCAASALAARTGFFRRLDPPKETALRERTAEGSDAAPAGELRAPAAAAPAVPRADRRPGLSKLAEAPAEARRVAPVLPTVRAPEAAPVFRASVASSVASAILAVRLSENSRVASAGPDSSRPSSTRALSAETRDRACPLIVSAKSSDASDRAGPTAGVTASPPPDLEAHGEAPAIRAVRRRPRRSA